ncbi:fungal-specific transcription factor [Aspergillus piperis CBS 112811]|uniref:Fungal-specific transcription factor n=1 Tax=Aspergillus piperis CBS 112811 TaxID=1448313 RepID=A0A8G1R0Z5_9EURO|nr:fungal-specific transcription factor [Aspergillus piperis CBS 112811]RAH57384.1 fungal-specific transcription factor [Aspergillus piperis CBS 112811]
MERSENIASQACVACKRQKRRCDKRLPQCSLCLRTSRTCDYADTPKPPPTAADLENLQARLTELEERLGSITEQDSLSATAGISSSSSLATEPIGPNREPTSFPSALFLDIDCYKWSNMQLPRPAANIPMDILSILNQPNFVMDTTSLYFDTIHPWVPIISKKRLDLGISLKDGGPDIALLFLAMKLITLPPPPAPKITSKLYSSAKGFLATLEASGAVSFIYLQAMTLIALYEYSHSIYPAAWMTVGACARLTELLGITPGKDTMKIMSPAMTWTELEERRRVWWAIYILDRTISLGSRRRFCLPEPADTDVLPVDDDAWDLGDVANIIYYQVTTPLLTPMSPFSRLCQSAMFISRVAAHRSDSPAGLADHITSVLSLTEDLNTFSFIVAEEMDSSPTNGYIRLLAPRCLTWSALFLLLDNYCCPEKLSNEPGYTTSGDVKGPDELAAQVQATLVVRNISNQAHRTTTDIMDFVSNQRNDQMGRLSPLLLDALYCSMVTFQWVYREGADEEAKGLLADVEACMGRLSQRWKLASEYLALNEVYRGAAK